MSMLRSVVIAAFIAPATFAQVYLSPDQDILLPPSNTASSPLTWLGGSSPYFAGPNVNGVENKVPEGCVVDQVAFVARHGSRYPDQGAYSGWVNLYNKVSWLAIGRRRRVDRYFCRFKLRISRLPGT